MRVPVAPGGALIRASNWRARGHARAGSGRRRAFACPRALVPSCPPNLSSLNQCLATCSVRVPVAPGGALVRSSNRDSRKIADCVFGRKGRKGNQTRYSAGVSPALAVFASFASLCVLCVLNHRVVVSHGLKMYEIQHLGAWSVRVPVAPAGARVRASSWRARGHEGTQEPVRCEGAPLRALLPSCPRALRIYLL